MDTASGPAVMRDDGIETTLSLGGQDFTLEAVYAGFGPQVGNLVLLVLPTGGTACPAMFAWADTTPGAVSVGTPFGTCSDLAEVSHDAESVTVTLPSMEAGKGPVAFRWDGKAMTTAQLAVPPSGNTPAMGAAVWSGRYAYEFLTAPEWQDVLLGLMGKDDLLNAQTLHHDWR